MNVYCTLFDSNYLTRGLAMYQSLNDTGEEFLLYIFAFDDLADNILKMLELPNVEIVSLEQFENEDLLALKKERSRAEYCWTCTSFSILYVLENFSVPEVTYLDADLFFFDKPNILLDEFHKSSCDVLITKHRYSPQYCYHERTSGTYCVQFMTFKNNENGLKVLKWWCERCAECCISTPQDGKFGDQKYLDDWIDRFEKIHVLEYLGGGVAPWNVQQYAVEHGPSVNGEKVVFYHYHGLKMYDNNTYSLIAGYWLPQNVIEIFYLPYITALEYALKLVEKTIDSHFSVGKLPVSKATVSYGNIMHSLLRYGVDNTSKTSRIIIYGAGNVAKDVIHVLASLDINRFDVVESRVDNSKFLMGNKVSCIEDYIDYKDEAVVILAVGIRLQGELKENAQRLGFKNIVSLI